MASYLEKQALFPPQIKTATPVDLGIVVVIPCFDEENLLESLDALEACELPDCGVEVIVVINSSENSPERILAQNQRTLERARDWITSGTRKLSHHLLYHPQLPKKHAGVGLARKIGMDEAVFRLESIGNQEGILLCFDADSQCAPNYLVEVERHFAQYPKSQACNIYFEHPLEGKEDEAVYIAIAKYELALRYFVQAQRYAGFPLAYQTIGSSMAVRSSAYQAQGGMNRRKAGEDFYFLHKFIPLGYFTEIKGTKVIPSPRQSDRVPFGTGKAVGDIIGQDLDFQYYHLNSFLDLKVFITAVPQLFEIESANVHLWKAGIPESICQFLETISFEDKLEEIKKNTTGLDSFLNRFYRFFNAFVLMKYVHFARDHFYPNKKIETLSQELLALIIETEKQEMDRVELLRTFREMERG